MRKCVSMNPKDRYQNVDELMRALEYAVDVKTEGKDMESGHRIESLDFEVKSSGR